MKSSHGLCCKWVPNVDVPLQTTSDNEIVASRYRHKTMPGTKSDLATQPSRIRRLKVAFENIEEIVS